MSFLFTNRTFMIPRSAKLSTTIKAEILYFFFRSLHFLIFYQFFHAKINFFSINFFSIWHTHTPQTILSHKQPDFLYIQMPSFSTTVVVVARIVFVGTRVASYISVEKKQEKKEKENEFIFSYFSPFYNEPFTERGVAVWRKAIKKHDATNASLRPTKNVGLSSTFKIISRALS